MRPIMTKYEYALICYERYKSMGDTETADAYKRLIDRMTVEDAGRQL